MQKSVSLHTLGCRLNISETGAIAQSFANKGYKIVPFGEKSDVVYINTCTVTDSADSTCRNLIRKANKKSPGAKIVVVGCYAQMDPEAIARIEGVDLILGNSDKHKVFDYLDESDDLEVRVDSTDEFWGAGHRPADSHSRAFLKIQDGCNYICSYCIIPQARGRSRAISIKEAVLAAKKLVNQGFKEIILTGVNIGEYEKSAGERLSHLLKELLAVKGLERLRLSSVEPNTITDELLDVLKSSDKFMHHFHIPLQSGDDQILQEMRRKYTVAEYKAVIEKILNVFPNAGIGADMIVGHPGEKKEQFEKTYNLAKQLPITHFHVFPYSKRKNTVSSFMDNHIHEMVKKERSKSLQFLGEAKLLQFCEDQVGKRAKVLFEQKKKNGQYVGYTENYVKVYTFSKQDLCAKIQNVYISSFENGLLQCSTIS